MLGYTPPPPPQLPVHGPPVPFCPFVPFAVLGRSAGGGPLLHARERLAATVCRYFQSLCVFIKSRLILRAPPPPAVGPGGGRPGRPSAREANLAREQESHYGEEDGEHEEHVRGADHRVVGQLVRLAPHLVDVEAYGEDERRHAEQDHWEEEGRRER